MTPCIIGWAHSAFGKREEPDVEALMATVAADALAHAGVEPADVGAVHVGVFNAGFSKQDFFASMVFQALPALRFIPATRHENACATGSAAIHAALADIRAGKTRVALVVGAEKMTASPPAQIADALLAASYRREEDQVEAGFAGIFGRIAQTYFQRHGDQSDALAAIAAKNHKHGVGNPYAQMRRDLGFAFCRTESEKNPVVAGPLKRTDCSLVSDGAAALVIADDETARTMARAVGFRAAAQVNDFLPMSRRDPIAFEGCEIAWARAHDAAGTTLGDLSFVETHDCFTIAELIEYEAMGLAPRGQGARVALDGTTAQGGRLPVNPSGGLKSKGHPIGATGVSQHVMVAMQLAGDAGAMQVPGASLGGVFNMGGAAVASYCSILERVK